MNVNLFLQEDKEEQEGMLQAENTTSTAEAGALIPPPGNGRSASQRVAIGYQGTLFLSER